MTNIYKLELMSGSKIRLPPHCHVTIDDPAELVALLCHPEGCFFHTSRSKSNIVHGKVVPVLNLPGPMTILAAIELIEKDYIPYLLWESTKVPGELQHVRRIQVLPEPQILTSDEESIQGWSYIDLPKYTLDRMYVGDSKYIEAIEKALKDGRITKDQLEKAIEEVEETTNNKEGD